ncbi:MAG: sulfatase [Bacteroidota bacterium]
MKSFFALVPVVFFLISCDQSKRPTHPNILFIAVDDMNDWIGPLGGLEIAKTPNLDRLAAQSTVFTNAHCASPACAPSRLSIMTGVQPSKTGVMKNVWYDGPQWRKVPILKEVETIEQFFKNRGYKTLGGGKLYHSLAPPWLITNQAEPESWDFYFPSAHVPMPYQVRAKEAVIRPDHFIGERHPFFTWGPLEVTDQKMSDYQVVDWARYELTKDHEKPFYLACGIFRPHMPWEVPQKYFDMYPLEQIPDLDIREDDLSDAFGHGRRLWHKFVLDNQQWKHVIQAYLASITFADVQIGRLLHGLEQSAYKDNTIIVLWADHGMHIGEKENWEKFTLWEESTRVPFFVKVPGIKQVAESGVPVSLLDIYPTLAESAGFEVPTHCDGQSVLAEMKGESPIRSHSALTSFQFDKEVTGHSLRSLTHRYIYYTGLHLEELYDHNQDPNEFHNLAYDPAHQSTLEKFRQEILQRVEGLSEANIKQFPKGYVLEGGRISKQNFQPTHQLTYE